MADEFKISERASLAGAGSKNGKDAASPIPQQEGNASKSPYIPDILNFSSGDFMKSIILSEILGKPKSMRKARW